MRTIIFVNGEFSNPHQANALIRSEDFVMAVNGGTRHALCMGVIPHAIIGDLDSLTSEQRVQIEAAEVTLYQFPEKKDETDLELALHYTIKNGATEVVLLAALGGRIDHALANIFLLTRPELAGCEAWMVHEGQIVFLIKDQVHITGKPGDTVSILPIGGDAIGVSNKGLEWPLCNASLPLGSPRGMSNVLLGKDARITIREGLLLGIVTPQNAEEYIILPTRAPL